MLLAQHPAVATTYETYLFDKYISPLYDAWKQHLATPAKIGLKAALTEEQFTALCTHFAKGVIQHIAQTNSRARVVVEKTPNHVHHVPLILKLFPDAYFIHLVRDPRAAVASLCAAGRSSWGRTWASPDPLENARIWVRDVSAGCEIASLTEHSVTVKYEALLEPAGWRILKDLFDRMGLDADDGFCQNALEECSIDRIHKRRESLNSHGLAKGDGGDFFRKGKADSWMDELSARDVKVIEYITGDLMGECGYTASTKFASSRKPWPLKRRELLNSLEWRANRAVALAFRAARRWG